MRGVVSAKEARHTWTSSFSKQSEAGGKRQDEIPDVVSIFFKWLRLLIGTVHGGALEVIPNPADE